MPYVYSTLSGDQNYTLYESNPNDATKDTPRKIASVFIKGGANVMPKPGAGFGTPAGAETEISSDELDLLEKNPVFKTHVDNGHIKVVNSKKPLEKAVSDMQKKDGSAPLTPDAFKDSDIKPSVGKPVSK